MGKASSQSKREFTVDENIINHIIERQAGSIEKAIMELVMNAVDANATRIDIIYSKNSLSVKDNGDGFKSKDDIINYFERFGTPHKDGDSTFGRFRMGRGQLFSFGASKWISNTFSMTVNIKNGLHYILEEDLDFLDGCLVECELYEVQNINISASLRDKFEYLGVDIYVNNEKLNSSIEDTKWCFENDEFYYLSENAKGVDSSKLIIYNQGIYVSSESSWMSEKSGVLVSKIPMDVNFARNDVLKAKCKVWKSFEKYYSELRAAKLKKTMYKSQKIKMYDIGTYIEMFMRDEISLVNILSLRVLFLSNEETKPLFSLFTESIKHIAKAKRKDFGASDKLSQYPFIYILNDDVDYYFKYSDEHIEFKNFIDFFDYISSLVLEGIGLRDTEIIDFFKKKLGDKYGVESTIKKNIFYLRKNGFYNFYNPLKLLKIYNTEYEYVKKKELDKKEVLILSCIDGMNRLLAKRIGKEKRKLLVGRSFGSLEAWTDGDTFIAVDIEMLRESVKSKADAERLALVILHEYCHSINDAQENRHDMEFYKYFHDMALKNRYGRKGFIGDAVDGFANSVVGKFEKASIGISPELSKVKYGRAQEPKYATFKRIDSLKLIKVEKSKVERNDIFSNIKNRKYSGINSSSVTTLELEVSDKDVQMSIVVKANRDYSLVEDFRHDLKTPGSENFLTLLFYFKDLLHDITLLDGVSYLGFSIFEKGDIRKANRNLSYKEGKVFSKILHQIEHIRSVEEMIVAYDKIMQNVQKYASDLKDSGNLILLEKVLVYYVALECARLDIWDEDREPFELISEDMYLSAMPVL